MAASSSRRSSRTRKILVPVLLVHGSADTDVRPDQTENAAEHIPDAQVIRVRNGTHLCMWTDPASGDIQERVAATMTGA
jgi:pimeloyl-ACP methyl ester carboxylesterase